MITDRELLEKAAKAAGLVIKRSRLEDPMLGNMLIFAPQPDEHNRAYIGWNPLTDDGDALRLAVNLEIEVRNFNGDSHAGQTGKFWCTEKWFIYGAAPYAATRRAIVRAAAAIGDQP